MLVKDVYFNLVEPSDLGLARDLEDEYLVELLKDDSADMYADVNKVNKLLIAKGYKPIDAAQNQGVRFKEYVKDLYFMHYGRQCGLNYTKHFLDHELSSKNIDWYFLSKYLGVNNIDQLTQWIRKTIKSANEIDLLKIKLASNRKY